MGRVEAQGAGFRKGGRGALRPDALGKALGSCGASACPAVDRGHTCLVPPAGSTETTPAGDSED